VVEKRGIFVSETDLKQELILKVLDALKTKVSEFNYNNWFKTSSLSFDGDTLGGTPLVKIQVPSKFVRDWIQENYLAIIKFEFFKLTGIEHEVVFKIGALPSTPLLTAPATIVSTSQETTLTLPSPKITAVPRDTAPILPLYNGAQRGAAPKIPNPDANLNPRYTFDNYVVGNSNQFVHAASRAVATNPAKNYNPLFIYGGVGLGKTHLLNAICLDILRVNPYWKVRLLTGEQFTNEVINSIRYQKTFELRQKYRNNCDILLIDDIQFIAGKERTMEEFFHTFNALYECRKQIILTSDTLPKDIPNLEERLRSRFSWGLMADIQAPDLETRVAILKKKAEEDAIPISDEVAHYIAARVKANVRDLEGTLVRVSALASLSSVPISLELVAELLKKTASAFQPSLSIEQVQQMVADHFQLKIADLKSPRRHKNLAFPRQIAMYLCKKHIRASYPEIGQKFGGKDHTTVIHAFQKITDSVERDSSLKSNIEQLEKLLSFNS